ncbi:SDR family NAD(P)-dependent oxidoreductase [Actinophytocola sp.]|jgi:NAD(P)-dependent dehydrogenase (short-subunit alcohol dehydrogenase family)|uniref:SDR family NAD(P)-dependent oxidoreductase n=1 Tax=Actinophytocola sp. TaxID=1872138 RepID=UPI002ED8990F
MADAKARNAVVTGASKGIGLAVATALRDEGFHVVAGARTISAELKEITPLAVPVDLGTPDGPGYLVDTAIAELGGIDLLVNNVAGTTGPHPRGFLSVTDDDWQHTLGLTLLSAVRASRAALPSIRERRGHIINIGSVNSRRPAPHLVDYSAAKAALANLGKALAEEFGPHGVRVNTISPGPVRTAVWTEPGGTGDLLAKKAGIAREEFLHALPANFGMSTGHMTEPAEIAALVVFLVSGSAPNINGSDLVIDGGLRNEV